SDSHSSTSLASIFPHVCWSHVAASYHWRKSRNDALPLRYATRCSYSSKSSWVCKLPPVKYISATELRALFNDGRYTELVGYGVLKEHLIREGTPSASANEPAGTRSQVVAYVDGQGKQACIVHRYDRPDGSLGGSGRPDPKKVLSNGVLYVLDETL